MTRLTRRMGVLHDFIDADTMKKRREAYSLIFGAMPFWYATTVRYRHRSAEFQLAPDSDFVMSEILVFFQRPPELGTHGGKPVTVRLIYNGRTFTYNLVSWDPDMQEYSIKTPRLCFRMNRTLTIEVDRHRHMTIEISLAGLKLYPQMREMQRRLAAK